MAIEPPNSLLRPGLLIGDSWVDQSSGGTMDHINPATGKAQITFPLAGAAEVDDAVGAARAAFDGWRKFAPADRRRVLSRIAELLRERAADIGAISTLEMGIVSSFSSYLAPVSADWFDYYAGWVDKIEGGVYPVPGMLDYTLTEPVGVVAAILPYNGPASLIGFKVAPALAAGCCIVIKPPELAPFSTNLFAELCLEAGLPAGVLNVVAGGPAAGDALVRHPGVDKITFTGGPDTAKRIQAAAAESLTPLVLELGGKSANIVFEDADLGAAAMSGAMGIVALSGQVCVAGTRLLVQDSVYDEVVDGVNNMLDMFPVGDPQDPASMVGPVISQGACDRILGLVDRARSSGAGTVLRGGERLGGELADGYFIPPTVVVDVDNSSEIAQEEAFGPVLSVIRFTTDDEAVSLANDSKYGLAAYVHTNSLKRAHTMAAELDAGNIAINSGMPVGGPHAPFGGFKQSGYGKEGGLVGLHEFLRVKNVSVGLS